MSKIIQISDSHIIGDENARFLGIDSRASFESVLGFVKREDADLIVFTGDLSQDETSASYKYIAQQLQNLDAPIACVPGNHDNAELMADVLKCKQKQIFLGNWHLVLLNSHYDGHESGILPEDELSFLDKALQTNPDKHAMILLHHHIVPTGSPWMDGMMVENRQDILDILDKHQQVKLVVYGHIHQEFGGKYKNINCLGAPATSLQFKPSTQELTIDDISPGYRWIELNCDGSFTSKVARI